VLRGADSPVPLKDSARTGSSASIRRGACWPGESPGSGLGDGVLWPECAKDGVTEALPRLVNCRTDGVDACRAREGRCLTDILNRTFPCDEE
jgi:hypothetical protein